MNSKFHQLAVEIAINAMSEEYKEAFTKDFPIELLRECADVPYIPSKFGEDEALHLDHSYKLALKGRDLHRVGGASVLDEILGFATSIPGLAENGNEKLVRYNIVKATHYIIDIATYPHLNETVWDKYHAKFEDNAATWLEAHRHIIEELVLNYIPNPMKSVPNRARAIAEEAFFDSMEYLPAYKRNGMATDLMWANMSVKQVYALMDWFATFEKYICK